MAARYGLYELKTVAAQYLSEDSIVQKTLPSSCNNAGFFPMDTKLIPKFMEIYLEATKKIDLFLGWNFRHGLGITKNAFFRNFVLRRY